MNGHLLRCQSALRAHVRLSTLRARGLLASRSGWKRPFAFRTLGAVQIPPCIWPFLNRLPYPMTRTHS